MRSRHKYWFQNIMNGRTPQAIGTIFSDTSWSASNIDSSGTKDYTINGTGISVVGNAIQLTGNPTLFTSYVTFTRPNSPFKLTCLERWKQRVKVLTPSSFAGTSYGFGIGINSIGVDGVNESSTSFRWIWDTTLNPGQVAMYVIRGLTNQQFSGTSLVPTSNTVYTIEVERIKNVFTYTIFDSAGTTQLYQTTFTTSLTSGYVQPHNTGLFCLQNYGGTILASEWTGSSAAQKNIDVAVKGDSNTGPGMFALLNSNRWVEQAMTSKNKSWTLCAGYNERTVEAVQSMAEVLGLRPKTLIINLGRNDLAMSVPLATVQANILSMVLQAQAAGIKVIVCTPFASNVDLSALAAWIIGTLPGLAPGVIICDFFGLTANGTVLKTIYNSGDQIHGNVLMNTDASTTLIAVIP